jgi:hypothetical protein
MSPRAYDQEIRYPQWREARKKQLSLGRRAAATAKQDAATNGGATSLLGAEAKTDPAPVFRINRILRKTADEYEVSISALRGDIREARVVAARHTAMWQLRQLNLTLQQIGRVLGDKDHTSVRHGIAKYESGRVPPPEKFKQFFVVSFKSESRPECKRWKIEEYRLIKQMRADKVSFASLGDHFGVSEYAVRNALRRFLIMEARSAR